MFYFGNHKKHYMRWTYLKFVKPDNSAAYHVQKGKAIQLWCADKYFSEYAYAEECRNLRKFPELNKSVAYGMNRPWMVKHRIKTGFTGEIYKVRDPSTSEIYIVKKIHTRKFKSHGVRKPQELKGIARKLNFLKLTARSLGSIVWQGFDPHDFLVILC